MIKVNKTLRMGKILDKIINFNESKFFSIIIVPIRKYPESTLSRF